MFVKWKKQMIVAWILVALVGYTIMYTRHIYRFKESSIEKVKMDMTLKEVKRLLGPSKTMEDMACSQCSAASEKRVYYGNTGFWSGYETDFVHICFQGGVVCEISRISKKKQ